MLWSLTLNMLKYFAILLCFSGFLNGQCPGNRYNSNQQKDTSTCTVWGGYNVKTFDDHGINFKSDCTFTMTFFRFENVEFRVDIGGNNNNCRRLRAGCHTFVNIKYKKDAYALFLNDQGLPSFTVDETTTGIPFENKEMRVYRSQGIIFVDFFTLGVVLKWNTKDIVEITIENGRQYQTFGLCGNNDRCSTNDQMLANQVAVEDLRLFLQEWQIDKQSCRGTIDTTPTCAIGPKKQQAANACGILRGGKFTEANKILDPGLYIEACIWNYCACQAQDTSCMCDTLDAYARASIHAGVRRVSWRDDATCPTSCTGDQHFYPCAPLGVRTCDGNTIITKDSKCEEGCYCQVATYEFGDKCYLRKNCPCLFKGKIYQPGESFWNDCHTCVCESGKIKCTEEVCYPRHACCYGDPHYETWDGRKYDFMGKCAYYLIKGKNFSVEADHYVYDYKSNQFLKENSTAPSYAAVIFVRVPGLVVELRRDFAVFANGKLVTRFPFRMADTTISRISGYVVVELPNKIQVLKDYFALVYFRLPSYMEGKVTGLMGTYTEDPSDDFLTPDGEIVETEVAFGNSWKTEYSCQDHSETPTHPCDANPSARTPAEQACSIIKSDLFKPCEIEDVATYFDNCVYDTCYCQDNPSKCACTVIAAFALGCAKKGVVVNWRNQMPQCRIECPAGQVYQECANMCENSCEDISIRPDCQKACIEGCNCAPGTTLNEDGKCIPIEKCNCRFNGIIYPPGYQILKNIDELITCTNARWISSVPIEEQPLPPTIEELNRKCDVDRFSVYTPCQYDPPLTCQNMHTFEVTVIDNCQEGCECMEGYIFDLSTTRCVTPENCPCLHNEQSYVEGSVVVQEGCNKCTCVNRSWQCKKENCNNFCTGDETKQVDCNTCTCKGSLWSCTQNDCSAQCAKKGETKRVDCNTCVCANGFWKCTNEICECKDGQEKQEGCKRCVCNNGIWTCNEENCGTNECINEGEVKIEKYGKCICKKGAWQCTDGQCGVWGNSHIETFDQLHFNFIGVCTYVLTKGKIDDVEFQVHFTNEICSHTGAARLKSATIIVKIGGLEESITLVKHMGLPNTENLKNIILSDKYLFAEIEVVKAGIRVFWDKKTWLYVQLDYRWHQKVTGLCGHFNQHKGDTDVTQNNIPAFVDMWVVDSTCEPAKSNTNNYDETRFKWAQEQCSILTSRIFAPCHRNAPVEYFYRACVMDASQCDEGGDCECLCTVIAAYAQHCNDYGAPIKWRSQELCAIQCFGNTEYQPCVTSCPQKTCETLRNGITVGCEKETCKENCGPKPLPTGHVYVDSTFQKDVPEEACNLQCNLRGNIYYDRDVTQQTDCKICVCSKGDEICTDLPCPDASVPPPTTTDPVTWPTVTTAKPPVCKKDECKPTKCPSFTKEAEIPGQCCKSCQHETKCITYLRYSKKLVLKKPGKVWVDGPCRECTCVGNENYNHCTQCKEKICAKTTATNITTEDTYYEITKGPCCPAKKPVACVHNKMIYRIGEVWKVDECKQIKCVKNPTSGLPVKQEISEYCNEACPVGYIYKKPDNACCGQCVQDSCVFQNRARKLGERWYSKDKCTNYNCELVQGQYTVFSYRIICPSVTNCTGEIKQSGCCQFCIVSELFEWQDEPLNCNYSHEN